MAEALPVPERFAGPGRFYVTDAGEIHLGDPEAYRRFEDRPGDTDAPEDDPDLRSILADIQITDGNDLEEHEVEWVAQALNVHAGKPPLG